VKVLGQADRVIALAHDNVWAYYVKTIYLAITNRANEALGSAAAGLAVDPNFARLYVARATAENFLGRFDEAKSDISLRLSPHDPEVGWWHGALASAELGQQHYRDAIDEAKQAIDGGWRPYIPYSILATAYALNGQMDEARSALAEARRLNPKYTVKWLVSLGMHDPARLDALRKPGCPRNERTRGAETPDKPLNMHREPPVTVETGRIDRALNLRRTRYATTRLRMSSMIATAALRTMTAAG
jgi:tetratricopeptide (TPR) repeat protein